MSKNKDQDIFEKKDNVLVTSPDQKNSHEVETNSIRKHQIVQNTEQVEEFRSPQPSTSEDPNETQLADLLSQIFGFKVPSKADEITITTLPEEERNDDLGYKVIKEYTKRYVNTPLTGKSAEVRYAIESIRNNFDGLLSHNQVKSILLNISAGTFKDVIAHVFNNNDTEKAVAHILNLYGDIIDDIELRAQFHNLKLDFNNIDESMTRVIEKALQCFTNDSLEMVSQKSMYKILDHLPYKSTYEVIKKMNQHECIRKISPSVKQLSFYNFKKLVIDNIQLLDAQSNILEIKTMSEKAKGASGHSTSAEIEVLKETQKELKNVIKAIEHQPRHIRSQRRRKIQLMHINPNQPEHSIAIRHLKENGSTILNVMEKALNSARKWRKRNWYLKISYDESKLPILLKNLEGKIIHESQPFERPMFVRLHNGRYSLSEAVLHKITKVCFRCFFKDCSPAYSGCPFYNRPENDPFEICNFCLRGFHFPSNCIFAKN